MRILLLTDELLPGGVSRHVTDLANGLYTEGLQPFVAATSGPFRNKLLPEIPFVDLQLLYPNTYKKNLIGTIRSYKKLHTFIGAHEIQIVHSHKRYSDLLGRILSRRNSIPHLSTCHSTFSDHRWLSYFGDHTIACCVQINQSLIDIYKKNKHTITQIYSGIKPFRLYSDTEKMNVLEKIHLTKDKRIIGSVGQLVESKDYITLLRAVKILKESIGLANIVFVIQGNGNKRKHLTSFMRNAKIENSVRFVNDVDPEALMNISEFMVLSSIQEGFPYVLLEAASLAKPYIATRVGGISEFIVHDKTGILVPVRNHAHLANSIQELLMDQNKIRTLGINAQEKYQKNYNLKKFITEMKNVYEHMI